MIRLWPDREVQVLKTRAGRVPLLVVRPKEPADRAPGVLWIHGGGYILGLKEMVYMSRAMDLVKHFGAVVVSPRVPSGLAEALSGRRKRLLRSAAVHGGPCGRMGDRSGADHGWRRECRRRAGGRRLHAGQGSKRDPGCLPDAAVSDAQQYRYGIFKEQSRASLEYTKESHRMVVLSARPREEKSISLCFACLADRL